MRGFSLAYPDAPEFTDRILRPGLLANNVLPGAWGNDNSHHVDERLFAGGGPALAFRDLDPVPEDNGKSITVTIECVSWPNPLHAGAAGAPRLPGGALLFLAPRPDLYQDGW